MQCRFGSALALVLLGACAARPVPAHLSLFTGMCDASGAVPLSARTFAVADDEDNVIRIYDAAQAGPPLSSVDLSPSLGLTQKRSRKTGQLADPPETDIEGATRVGDLAFWITSHGRNASGKHKPERFRFFATSAPVEASGSAREPGSDASALHVIGRPYQGLLDDLLLDPRYGAFGLARASQLAPKADGGLNIEGLSERAQGGVLVGFRSPVPDEKALLAPLLNPSEVVQGEHARFGDPISLDLGGLGIRGITRWHGRYLVLAGARGEGGDTRLFVWDGERTPVPVTSSAELRGLNPEGFFGPEQQQRVLLLSDDGTLSIEGEECKRLEDTSKKRFRGLWIDGARLGL